MSSIAPFGDCKKAVLQNTAFIQGDGALIGVDVHTQLITVCSENLSEVMGKPPESVLGKSAIQVFEIHWGQLARIASEEGRHQVCEITLAGKQPLTVVGHRRGDFFLFEIMRGSQYMPSWWNHAARTSFLENLTAARSVEQCVALLVDTVFQHAGLDRVMCYRFLPDWHGEVIHEACRPGIDGFLGLRFPASDLPANARQLYTLNWHRVIADVDEKTVPLRYWAENGPAPDLTYSILRAVHPVHIQYLRNMGVQASLSLSLVANGKLWGLVACHHMTHLTLNIHDRLALEEIAKLVSLHLRNLLGLIDQERQSNLRENLSMVRGTLQASSDNPQNGLALILGQLRDLFRANGVWLHFEGEDHFVGLTPEQQTLGPLRNWLDLLPKETISQYYQLPESLASHPAIVRHASGVLYIPLNPSDYLVLMRQEVVHVVNWAGQPASLDDNDSRSLTPRNSFAIWAQQVRNSAEPWHDSEVSCAETLRKELIDFINMARLEQIALHDPLTGLANRLQFDKRMNLEVRNAFSRSGQFAVHMIDLDKFKPVNDTLGHAAGDDLLKAVSKRLLQLVRAQDTVARLGGDEFAVIQSGVSGREAASNMADRIVQEIAKPYEIKGTKVEIGTSVGVALFPADSSDQSELLHQADIALYAVKKAGRNAFSLFAPTMREGDERELDANALLEAMERGQLELFYQPIVDARNGELRGLESFIRWHHPKEGLLTAEQFIPRVEQLHLGPAIGRWVLDATFKQHRQWISIGLPSIPITVNIRSAQFASQDLVGEISELAKRYDTSLEWLRLDIKEDAILRDVNQAMGKLTALRANGVAAQLDNFGKGFVSLGFMNQFPFIGVKFDVSALQQTGDSNINIAVLSVVKGIARVLNAKLTITRVENEATAAWLRKQEVDLLQGFGICEPMPAGHIADWLDKHVKQLT
ncbi:EAL domain-containing protein [Halothiobacillus sp.]|uniref:bifunctional diguanylate cyclase/phosphodiesterase n=1 Tax=Halothiobacillus sp. TaxID=1891311 RepID=UPI002AD28A6C|nr:EAL domain-containing protein [Halothiobacillus sp.]